MSCVRASHAHQLSFMKSSTLIVSQQEPFLIADPEQLAGGPIFKVISAAAAIDRDC